MDQNEFRVLPANRVVRLDNISCPYCGALLSERTTSVEHVIGRGFVPKTTLNAAWNLILRACLECNARKGNLEDDISAITMAPDPSGRHAEDEPILKAEAERKGRDSISRRTRKPVSSSQEQVKIGAPFFGGRMTAEFTSPPQVERQRIYDLAQMQLMGFFYFLTFQEKEKRGWFWTPVGFHPFLHVVRSDWGNPSVVAFADAIANWDPRLITVSADGYYRALIRKHPTANCWAWALEWNRNYRVIGFFGDRDVAQRVVNELPEPEVTTIHKSPTNFVRFWKNVPLRDEDDKLFRVEDAAGDPEPGG